MTLEYPAEGGHVGFAIGDTPGANTWLPRRIVQFLQGDGAQAA